MINSEQRLFIVLIHDPCDLTHSEFSLIENVYPKDNNIIGEYSLQIERYFQIQDFMLSIKKYIKEMFFERQKTRERSIIQHKYHNKYFS